MRRLLIANAVLAALLLVHIADHALRQPAEEQLGAAASLPGLLGTVAVFVSLAVVALRRPWARALAGAVGVLTALGFAAVHLAPRWSMFSDPYADRALDAGSWIGMLVSLAAGVVLALMARTARSGGAPRRRGLPAD
jgi:hypothetical protein